MTVGTRWIDEERERQLKLGYTVEHDDEWHEPEQLLAAGLCYIEHANNEATNSQGDNPPFNWPVNSGIPWKPEDSILENLVKGGAFVAAALDLYNHRMLQGAV